MKDLSGPTAHGMNNLLYLALVSPVDYYKEGQGSLMQGGAVETTVYCQLGAGGSGGGHWALQGGVVQPACPSLMHACTHVELLPLPPPAFCLVPAAMRADPRSPLQAHTLDFRCLPCCVFFVLQCVLTPAAPYMSKTNEEIAAETDRQVGAAALGARSSRLGRLNECWAGRLFAPQSKAELPPSRLIPTTSFLSPPLPALCCCHTPSRTTSTGGPARGAGQWGAEGAEEAESCAGEAGQRGCTGDAGRAVGSSCYLIVDAAAWVAAHASVPLAGGRPLLHRMSF